MRLIDCLRLDEYAAKPVIALTGAGGKSTLLFALGRELAATGRQVLLTATTRLWAAQIDQAPFSLIASDTALLAGELPTSLRGYKAVLVMAGAASEPDKLRGLAPTAICRLAALAEVDAAVVEADGSRERHLKTPAAHEPAVPPCATHLLVVAGASVVGRPLDERTVHRPLLVGQLTGLAQDATLTADAVARLLLHPAGGLKGRPSGTSAWLFLNLMDDTEGLLATARRIARQVLAPEREAKAGGQTTGRPARGYAAVLIGSAANVDPVLEAHGRVAAVVLAAGRSRRFGDRGAKQLAPWGREETLVGHVVETALAAGGINEVVAVAGYQAEAVGRALAGKATAVVANGAWQQGQGSSVAAGLREALRLAPDLSAALFLLADQPEVVPGTVDALIEAHRRTQAPIVAPRYRGGARGNPVLFDRSTFPDLLALTGDVGGRALFEAYGDRVQTVTIDRPQPQGIETVADYRERLAAWRDHGRNE